jgi:2-octaprenyl-6-methoxyphenol hydroxylase
MHLKKSSNNDGRALALSNGSRLVFEEIGIWREIQAKVIPINEIHTSQKGSFGRSLFTTEDTKEDALGYIISYADLLNVLKKKVKKESFLESATVEYINTEEKKIFFHTQRRKKNFLFRFVSIGRWWPI